MGLVSLDSPSLPPHSQEMAAVVPCIDIQTQLHSKQEAKGSTGRGSPPPLPFTQEENLLPVLPCRLPLHLMDQKALTYLPLSPEARPIFPEFE